MKKSRWLRKGHIVLFVAMCVLMVLVTEPISADRTTAEYNALMDRVQETEQLPVIVTLDLKTPFQPEGRLSAMAVKAQRTAIATAQAELSQQLLPYGARVYVEYEVFPLLAVVADEAALRFLTTSPLVTGIEEDVAVPVALLSSTAVIGAPATWSQGYDGSGWAVVVLDNGIDSNHPFLTGRMPAEYCFSNANGAGAGVSLCPNGAPYDTSADVEIPACSVSTPGDLCSHGSHVAGIAGGADNGGVPGYNGVAPDAQVIPIQVFTRFNSGCSPTSPCTLSYSSDQLLALQYIFTTLRLSHNISSVNMSLGGGQYYTACDGNSLKMAIDSLLSVGIATIIASGNEGWSDSIAAPGCISTAVTVGATTDGDTVASFSNSNALVDLLAPGVAIDSSVPNDSYGSKQGTSMATPHVAGAWAVLKEANPTATPAEILAALQQYGISVTDSRNGLIRSRIQLDRAAAALQPATWVGNTADWNTLTNWSTNSLPRCGTPITIPIAPVGGNFPVVDGDAAVGTVTIADGAELSMADHTLTVCGDWVAQGNGQFNATGGTVVFAGSNQAITLPSGVNGQFYNVQIGDGTITQQVTLASDVTIGGNLTFQSPAALDANGRTLTVAGDWLDYGSGFMPNGGAVFFNSPTTQSVGNATFELLNEPFDEADGQTCCSSGFLPAGWVREHASGFGFMAGDITSYGGNGGAAIRWSDSLSAWLHTPGLSLQPGTTYELEYKYRLLFASAINPQNFAVYLGTSQNAASMTTLLHQVNNVTSATFATATTTFTVDSSGQYYLGFYIEQSATGVYAVIDDVILRATSTRNEFYDVQIDQGITTFAHDLVVGNDLTITEGADLTVEGLVTNNGRFLQTLTAPDTATTSFLHIQNAAGDADKYFGLDITPTGDMGSTAVTIHGGQTCGTSGTLSNGVQRCYDITPGTAAAATVRFYYRTDEANGSTAPAVFHYEGGVWQPEAGISRGGSGEGLWVQATGVDAYSPFALADETPTAVSLTGVTAAAKAPGWSWPLVLLMASIVGLVFYRGKR